MIGVVLPLQDFSEATRVGLVQLEQTVLLAYDQLFRRIFIRLRCVVDVSLPYLHHKEGDRFLHQLFIRVEGFYRSLIVGEYVIANELLVTKEGVEGVRGILISALLGSVTVGRLLVVTWRISL